MKRHKNWQEFFKLCLGLILILLSPTATYSMSPFDLHWFDERVDSGEALPWGIDMDLDNSGNPHIVFQFIDLYYAHKVDSTWVINQVKSGLVSYPSIAVDSSGYLHLSYVATAPWTGVYYATNKTGGWVFELVDTLNAAYTSIALDDSDNPHISYYAVSTSDLKYSWRIGTLGNCGYNMNTLDPLGTWQCQDVDTTGDVGSYSSIALDDSNLPHISYRDASNNKLKYARLTSLPSSWQFEPLTTGGFYTSIELDNGNHPHIGFVGGNSEGVWYATKDINWDYEYVDAALDIIYGTSLALDGSGEARISYVNMDTYQLFYAVRVGSDGNCGVSNSWQCESVTEIGDSGDDSVLKMDSSDQPHIAFTGSLNYAIKEPGGWSIEPIQPDVGSYSSLDLNNNGKPGISYYDATFTDLKYAYRDGSDWEITWIESESYCGRYNSLEFDGLGKAHISYLAGGKLKYANNSGGSFVRQVVDSSPDVGHYNSLALDGDVYAHISYFDDANDDLKYATNATGAWVPEVVDQNGGASTSISLTSSGVPRISYFASNQLKYAVRVGGGVGNCYAGSHWDCEAISPAQYGTNSFLVLDGSAKPHIVYTSSSLPPAIIYVTKSSGVWLAETIYSGSGIGLMDITGSIVLDAEDNPVVAFCDGEESELWLAMRVGSGGNCGDDNAWQCKKLPYRCGISAPSIVLDQKGLPHISFESRSMENWTSDLMYSYGLLAVYLPLIMK